MYSGIKLAALYGIYPHQLGYCGSRRKSTPYQIYDFLCGKKVFQKKIRKILEGFKGAFFYYRLIAKSNKIKDPFDEKVVKAYWIGNKLLEKVKIEDLRKMIAKDFAKPGLLSKKIALKKAKEIPENSKPHHSFHVLILGSVTGRVILKGKLLDLCRISWGKVKDLREGKIKVEYQPLVIAKNLVLGKSIEKEISWDRNLIPEIKIGDWVSFHWNNAVERLQNREVASLKKYTEISIEILSKIRRRHFI